MAKNLSERQVRIKSESFAAVYAVMEANGIPESAVGGTINAILTKCAGFLGLPITPDEVRQRIREVMLNNNAPPLPPTPKAIEPRDSPAQSPAPPLTGHVFDDF